jgi:hypothetical protein
LIYSLVSGGPSTHTRRLSWHTYCQLGLDIFLFVLWLAATAASNYDCSGHEFYGGLYDVWVGSLTCGCANGAYVPGLQKVKRAMEGRDISSSTLNAGKEFETASKIAAKVGFDALMVYAGKFIHLFCNVLNCDSVLFASTTAVSFWRIYQIRKTFSHPEGHGPAIEVPNPDEVSKESTCTQKANDAGYTPPVPEVQ